MRGREGGRAREREITFNNGMGKSSRLIGENMNNEGVTFQLPA